MLKISRESEINLINVLIDNDVISGKDFLTYFNIDSVLSNKDFPLLPPLPTLNLESVTGRVLPVSYTHLTLPTLYSV